MLDTVFVKTYPAPPFNIREVLRYAGCLGRADEPLNTLLGECIAECEDVFSYRVCYREMQIDGNFFGDSQTAKKRLDGCEVSVIFAATVGLAIDRLIAKYAEVSTAKALLFQAIGAERIESLCNAFCADIAGKYQTRGLYARQRFSPGYGDFPLEKQTEFFRALDCPRKIGLTLSGSMLMSPTKSVTAVVGFTRGSEKPQTCETGCADCEKADCALRIV